MITKQNLISISALLILLLLGIKSNGQLQKYDLSRNDSALIKEYMDAYEKQLSMNHKKEASDHLNRAANIYWEHNHFAKAKDLYKLSLKLNEALGNENGIAMINSNLGVICNDEGKYNDAAEYMKKTLTVRTIRKDTIGIIAANINLSTVLNNLKRYDESSKRLLDALDYAREKNNLKKMRSCYGMLSETFEKAGDTKKSKYYFEYYRNFDKMVNEEKVKKANANAENAMLKAKLAEEREKIKQLELLNAENVIKKQSVELDTMHTKYDKALDSLSKKELIIKIYDQRETLNKLEEEKKRRKKRWQTILFSIIGLSLLLIIALLTHSIIRSKKTNRILSEKNFQISQQKEEINTQNDELKVAFSKIEKAHRNIQDSINYAQFIQISMLDKTHRLDYYLPNSFIIFKPKNIVSGDFYWYAKVKDELIIIAADCTGHGVPGGFLSMLGNNLFNIIIKNNLVTDPAQILHKLNKGIIESLNQETNHNTDGMDVSIITISPKTKTLKYAGAQNPIIVITNNELQKLQASRCSIGYRGEISMRKEVHFKTNVMEYTDDTSIYMFSDGYRDQFGGAKNKKYGSRRMYNLLEKVSNLPMKKQANALNEEFNTWKGENYQVDDILLIGINLKDINISEKKA